MNRRNLLAASLGTLALTASGPAAAIRPAPRPGLDRRQRAQLQRAAAECLRAGERCLTHCIALLSRGEAGMADCADAVREMLPICRAVVGLASTDSTEMEALARICHRVCTRCRDACAPHVDHHRTCRACHAACERTLALTANLS